MYLIEFGASTYAHQQHGDLCYVQIIVREPIARAMRSQQGDVYMAFEYLEYDLWALANSSQVNLTAVHIKTYMKQMLDAIAYMHTNKVTRFVKSMLELRFRTLFSCRVCGACSPSYESHLMLGLINSNILRRSTRLYCVSTQALRSRIVETGYAPVATDRLVRFFLFK